MLRRFDATLYYQPLGVGSKPSLGTEIRYGWAGPIVEEVDRTSAGQRWHFEKADGNCPEWRAVIELEGGDNTAAMELECPSSVGGAVGMTVALRISNITKCFLERIE